MIFFPDSCCQFVGIGIRGIGMDGPQDFIKANAMLHCQDKFREQISCMGTTDRGSKDLVFSWFRKDLHHSVVVAFRNRAVQTGKIKRGLFIGNILRQGIFFTDTDLGQFRIGEGASGHHAVIHCEFLERGKQCVDRCIPCLMACHMGELKRPGNIPAGVYVGDT